MTGILNMVDENEDEIIQENIDYVSDDFSKSDDK